MSESSRKNVCRSRKTANLPRWKKLLYGVSVAALLLVFFEVLLGMCGVKPLASKTDLVAGFSALLPHFEERAKLGEPPRMWTARNKLGYFNEQSFAVDKPSDVFRVFCLGGSTTYGKPYRDDTSYVGWLRLLLKTAYPQKRWEVVNAGGISYASYRLAALMKELVQYEPDLLIIYSGHNEFLEERTYGEIRARTSPRLWLTSMAAHTRTASLLHGLFGSTQSAAPKLHLVQEVDTKLDQTIGPTSYERDDELRAKIVADYEASLLQMVELAKDAGASLLFIRPACNLKDCTPFKSEPLATLSESDRLRWQTLLESGRRLHVQGDHRAAIRVLQQAQAIDDRAADVLELLGRAWFGVGDYVQAEAAFLRAVDEDICPLRMTSDLGKAFDRVVSDLDVRVIDFQEVLRGDCLRELGHPVLGREWFLDHVHPTIDAHGRLGQAIVNRLVDSGILSDQVDDWSYTMEIVSDRVWSNVDGEAHAKAEADLARVLYWAGKVDEAGPLALKSLSHNQEDARIWLLAGIHLQRLGRTHEAVAHLEHARRISPNDPRIQDAWSDVIEARQAAEYADAGTRIHSDSQSPQD